MNSLPSKSANRNLFKSGRGGQIRTDDILLPKQALYQAELRPVTGRESNVVAIANQALLTVLRSENYL